MLDILLGSPDLFEQAVLDDPLLWDIDAAEAALHTDDGSHGHDAGFDADMAAVVHENNMAMMEMMLIHNESEMLCEIASGGSYNPTYLELEWHY